MNPPGAGGLFFRVVRTADEQAAAAARRVSPGPVAPYGPPMATLRHVRRAGRVGGNRCCFAQAAAGGIVATCADVFLRNATATVRVPSLDRQAHLQRRVRVHRVRQRGPPAPHARAASCAAFVGVIVHLERVRPRLRAPDGEQPDSLAVPG